MNTATYQHRRGEIETYFDRTAAQAWARLTSDAPVGRIRATVRAGRDRMRATLLSWLPRGPAAACACSTPAAAPARWRSRPRAAAPRWWPSTCRRRWWRWRASALPESLRHGPRRLPQRRHARPAARPLRPRGGDGLADPLPTRTTWCGAVAAWPQRTRASMRLHLRAAHAGAGGHARGRQAVPARRPRAGHRAGAPSSTAPADRRRRRAGRPGTPGARSASPAASTPRRRWRLAVPDQRTAPQ